MMNREQMQEKYPQHKDLFEAADRFGLWTAYSGGIPMWLNAEHDQLSWRAERQELSKQCHPLKIFDEPAIDGQWFSKEIVQEYAKLIGSPGIVYERECHGGDSFLFDDH